MGGLLNQVRDDKLASTAKLLKQKQYPGCVMRNGKPCHCAKIVLGELRCGPTKDRKPMSVADAKNCERRTDHTKH